MGQRQNSFRVIVTYNGFDEEKFRKIVKVANRKPAEETFDPMESRSQAVWGYSSRGYAERLRMRLLGYLSSLEEWKDRFSISKVISDGF